MDELSDMQIRDEQAGDKDYIRWVLLEAFETDTEANLVDALRDSGVELISKIAIQEQKVVGHILFSPVTVNGNSKIMGLAPMAVLPEWQNQGIGSALVNEGLKACKQAGYDAVAVLGHPDYYPRFGFAPSVNYGLKSEYDVPAEVFMILELNKDTLRNINGTIKYHRVFNEI
jgi:putative acetyltransferase